MNTSLPESVRTALASVSLADKDTLQHRPAFMSGVLSDFPREAPLPRASADLVLPDLYFLFCHNTLAAP